MSDNKFIKQNKFIKCHSGKIDHKLHDLIPATGEHPYREKLFLMKENSSGEKHSGMAKSKSGNGEEKFRLLFANMAEGVAIHEMIFDAHGHPVNYRITEVNPAFEIHTHIKAEKAIGALASELYGTEKAPFLVEYAEALHSGISKTFESFFPPLQKYFIISVTAIGRQSFATIFTDITPQKEAEEMIRQSENRYRLIAENISDVLWVRNITREAFTYISPSVEKLRGYTVDEVLQQDLMEMVVPEDREMVAAIIAKQIRQIQSIPDPEPVLLELRQTHKNGGHRFVILL